MKVAELWRVTSISRLPQSWNVLSQCARHSFLDASKLVRGFDPVKTSQPAQGWVKVPNVVVENLFLLTRAETALVLMVLRRGKHPISDANWQKWTGLSPRLKDYASAGLAKKGLQVVGKGDKARYSFDLERWSEFVKAPDDDAARTLGRSKATSIAAPARMRIHESCREGCQMLCEAAASCKVVEITPTAPAAPVELKQAVNETPRAAAASGTNPKPRAVEKWPKSRAFVSRLYKSAGSDFIPKLLARISRPVTDDELERALDLAWQEKKGVQKSESLFFRTVPAVIDSWAVPDVVEDNRPVPAIDSSILALAAKLERVTIGGMQADFTPCVNELKRIARELASGTSPLELETPFLVAENRIRKLATAFLRSVDKPRFDAVCDRIRRDHPALNKKTEELNVEKGAVWELLELPHAGLLP